MKQKRRIVLLLLMFVLVDVYAMKQPQELSTVVVDIRDISSLDLEKSKDAARFVYYKEKLRTDRMKYQCADLFNMLFDEKNLKDYEPEIMKKDLLHIRNLHPDYYNQLKGKKVQVLSDPCYKTECKLACSLIGCLLPFLCTPLACSSCQNCGRAALCAFCLTGYCWKCCNSSNNEFEKDIQEI